MSYNLCKLCLIVACFCCFSNNANSKSSAKRKVLPDFEQVLPDGTVFPSPFFQSQRNWTAYKKAMEMYTKSLKQRVVGGRESIKGEAPYFAVFGIAENPKWPWCGGAIYNKDTVLTAAHCLYTGEELKEPSYFRVIVGKYNLHEEEGTEITLEISKLIAHKCFNSKSQYYDIAVVTLMEPLKYSKYIQPIPIPQSPTKFQGEMTVSGFGYTRKREAGSAIPDSPSGFSGILKVTNVTIMARYECKSEYIALSDEVYNLVKHKTIFCAGGKVKSGEVADACQGDSGGPAVCYSTNNKKYLCGLVSTGIGCGMTDYPGIYSKLYRMKHWIKETAGEGDEPTIDY